MSIWEASILHWLTDDRRTLAIPLARACEPTDGHRVNDAITTGVGAAVGGLSARLSCDEGLLEVQAADGFGDDGPGPVLDAIERAVPGLMDRTHISDPDKPALERLGEAAGALGDTAITIAALAAGALIVGLAVWAAVTQRRE